MAFPCAGLPIFALALFILHSQCGLKQQILTVYSFHFISLINKNCFGCVFINIYTINNDALSILSLQQRLVSLCRIVPYLYGAAECRHLVQQVLHPLLTLQRFRRYLTELQTCKNRNYIVTFSLFTLLLLLFLIFLLSLDSLLSVLPNFLILKAAALRCILQYHLIPLRVQYVCVYLAITNGDISIWRRRDH